MHLQRLFEEEKGHKKTSDTLQVLHITGVHEAPFIIMQMQCPWLHKVHHFKQIFGLSSVH